jgi:cobalt-zinc-cadmium efflux system protein
VAIAIGLWVLPRTWILLKDTTQILLEGVPAHLKLADIRTAIADAPGVGGVHDLHVWSMSSNDVSLSAHVVLAEGAEAETVRRGVAALLHDRFEIEHVTIQTELEACAAHESVHP